MQTDCQKILSPSDPAVSSKRAMKSTLKILPQTIECAATLQYLVKYLTAIRPTVTNSLVLCTTLKNMTGVIRGMTMHSDFCSIENTVCLLNMRHFVVMTRLHNCFGMLHKTDSEFISKSTNKFSPFTVIRQSVPDSRRTNEVCFCH